MNRILLAFGLWLALLGGVAAQGCGQQNPNCIVPTAQPYTTSNNQAASTAFVQGALTTGLPLANGDIYVGNSSNVATANAMSGDCTISNIGAIVCTKTNGVAFGTMANQSAAAVTISGGTITGLPNPTNSVDAATKGYVDSSRAGLIVLTASRLATAAALPTNTYSNGTAGVGATLTATANGALSVDSVAVNTNDVLLIQDESTPANNGIYIVTQPGSVSTPYILTRASYFNTSTTMLVAAYTTITAGSTNINKSFSLAATVTTVGTTAVTFNLFSSSSGTLTNIATSGCLTGGPITTTGTIGINCATTNLTDVISGTWTPTDGSGAGLTFSLVSARYTRIGNMVFAYAEVIYPSTANTNNAVINGFPVNFSAANYGRQCSVNYTNDTSGLSVRLLPTASSAAASFFSTSNAAIQNSRLSSRAIIFQCTYPAS